MSSITSTGREKHAQVPSNNLPYTLVLQVYLRNRKPQSKEFKELSKNAQSNEVNVSGIIIGDPVQVCHGLSPC